MKKIKIVLAAICVFVIYTCTQDDNWNTDNPPTEQEQSSGFSQNFGSQVNARFIGTVINEDNNPVSGVTVTIGNILATTDANGVFSIESASVFERFAYVKASKEGFIEGSRALVPATDGINQVTIMLLDIEPIATINAGEPSTVDLQNGTQVSFDGNFENMQGVSYSGAVQVTLKHLNPDNTSMELQMPGMLFAENESGSPRVLETYGMIAVELRGSSGEELDLAEGSTAQISVPVPSSVTSSPATIPLWYFDEDNGYWKEEGVATLQGGNYIGDVSHFTFWNWDFEYPAVQLCITLVDSNGNPLPYTAMDLYSPALASTGTYGYTNANGLECGLVPADDEMTLVVPTFGCVSSDFTTTIGPFSADENITIEVTTADALITNFIGQFNDCGGNPITNGYMQLFYNDSTQTIPIDNGFLELAIDYCSDNTAYSALVVDLLSSQITEVTNGNFTVPTTDLGMQMSCVDLTDSDSDGVFDIDEDINGDGNLDNDDTDDDGTPDYLDADDDGDEVDTADEDYDNDGNPTNDDTDEDGIPDYLDDQDVFLPPGSLYPNNCDFANLEYDLESYFTNIPGGSQFANMTFNFYQTLADAEADVNKISNPTLYINTSSFEVIFVRGTNSISNRFNIAELFLFEQSLLDSDGDGLTDCQELTGVNVNDINISECEPNGNITDPNNPDTDGDSFDDCFEATFGSDPNDPSSIPDTSPNFNCCDNNTLDDLNVSTITNPDNDVTVSDAFTPNGDGINDGLQIFNINLYPSNVLLIYDTQDNLVFEIDQYNNTTNIFLGTNSLNGFPLSDGTYRYELTFSDTNGQENIRNGFMCMVSQVYPNVSFQGCITTDGFDPLLN